MGMWKKPESEAMVRKPNKQHTKGSGCLLCLLEEGTGKGRIPRLKEGTEVGQKHSVMLIEFITFRLLRQTKSSKSKLELKRKLIKIRPSYIGYAKS